MIPTVAANLPTVEIAKSLGAFYTDLQIADFLVWWAIRSSQETVLDPSFGGGVFIRSACNRIEALGGKPHDQVFGIEFDIDVHKTISEKLKKEFSLDERNLWQRDFFDIEPLPVNKVNAVVGNPPFIRYHRFKSDMRQRALALAAEKGVQLTQLSSSWAPFLTHSVSMLKTGGRLAMVLPMEIGHASYALPVLGHLQKSFARSTFITFRKKLFPTLNEDTLLILAEGFELKPSGFFHKDLPHVGALSEIQSAQNRRIPGIKRLNANSLAKGTERLVEYLLPRRARELYQELRQGQEVNRLGEVADVAIGYVTGANDFFHLSPEKAKIREIPSDFLKPAVRKARALTGLRFTWDDWERAIQSDYAGFLLSIPPNVEVPKSVQLYLETGRKRRVSEGYKCRMRSPWYSVPHVYKPDGFLTYMSSGAPRLVSNEAKVVAPNSLHLIRIHPHAQVSILALAAMWQTSLTALSVEIEGHSLGGGMLKLEPGEAENCLIAGSNLCNELLEQLSNELDQLSRGSRLDQIQRRANEVILMQGLGFSHSDCQLLSEAAMTLRQRRVARGTFT